jgi:LacI family transcriptional regulator
MRISEETRKRVIEAAHDLDYHPHASARRLVTGKTRIIAYVERQPPERAFADAFLPQVLRGVHDAASTAHYEVLFAPIPVEESNGRCSQLLRGQHVDGIILSGPRRDDEELKGLIEAKAPVVIQGQWPGLAGASVDVDNIKAAKKATEHLLQLGHTRVGMIVHANPIYTAAFARLQGYREALEENGLPYDPDFVSKANFTPSSGERALNQLLKVNPPPTAIFASSDTVAIGAMRAAEQQDRRIPEDLAVVGFDDIPMAIYVDPPLTTVRLPAYGVGWGAADLLIRILSKEEISETNFMLDTELMIRGSCGAASP